MLGRMEMVRRRRCAVERAHSARALSSGPRPAADGPIGSALLRPPASVANCLALALRVITHEPVAQADAAAVWNVDAERASEYHRPTREGGIS